MPVKRRKKTSTARSRTGGARKRRVYRGAGFWDALKSAHNFIKSNKVISTVGNALGSVGVPYAGTIGNAAAALGYGIRRRRKRTVGGSLMSRLAKVHSFVKGNQLISKGLTHFGHPRFAAAAKNLGYGRKRKVRRIGNGHTNYFTTFQPSAPRFD